jgi:hypothetical protein
MGPRSHPHCADPVTVVAPESGSSVTIEVLCFSLSGSNPVAVASLFCISLCEGSVSLKVGAVFEHSRSSRELARTGLDRYRPNC